MQNFETIFYRDLNNMEKREYKELSSMAANGDAKAFSRLYSSIYREMYYSAFYCLANEKDTIEAIKLTARDGFKSISHLRNEDSFKIFMMKTLCARIKNFFKDYENNPVNENSNIEAKQLLFTLEPNDRLCLALFVGGKFTPEEISQYSGLSKKNVKKCLINSLTVLGINS